MKRIPLVLLALALCALCACATNSPAPAAASPSASPVATVSAATTAEMENMIIEREKKQWGLYKNKQVEEIKKSSTAGYRGVYGDGIRDKEKDAQATLLADMKEYNLSDFSVTFPTKDVAVMTYKSFQKGSFKGKDFTGTYYSSAVWVNDGGDWKSVLYAETKPEPQPKK